VVGTEVFSGGPAGRVEPGLEGAWAGSEALRLSWAVVVFAPRTKTSMRRSDHLYLSLCSTSSVPVIALWLFSLCWMMRIRLGATPRRLLVS